MQRLNIRSRLMEFPGQIAGQLHARGEQDVHANALRDCYNCARETPGKGLLCMAGLRARQMSACICRAALLARTMGNRVAGDVSTAMRTTSETAWSCCWIHLGCGVIDSAVNVYLEAALLQVLQLVLLQVQDDLRAAAQGRAACIPAGTSTTLRPKDPAEHTHAHEKRAPPTGQRGPLEWVESWRMTHTLPPPDACNILALACCI